jgi:hypothetical protein
VEVDASCIWRWVQAYAPELNKRCRPYLKPVNKSYRIDETCIKVKVEDKYLYRFLDSTGQTIDFLLTAKRDTAAAKRFLRRLSRHRAMPLPRVNEREQEPGISNCRGRVRWLAKRDNGWPSSLHRLVVRRCRLAGFQQLTVVHRSEPPLRNCATKPSRGTLLSAGSTPTMVCVIPTGRPVGSCDPHRARTTRQVGCLVRRSTVFRSGVDVAAEAGRETLEAVRVASVP